MAGSSDTLAKIMHFAGEVVAETLWPTRCALCDAPGKVLCERCVRSLPFLDWWRACPRCGSAFGRVQCDLCNPVMLARIGCDDLPFVGCASATMFCDRTGRLVRVYKDQGERRLAADMAALMVRVVPPGWRYQAVTFIPATKAAVRYRGFDHAELLAQEVAVLLGTRCVATLSRPRTRDQRQLSGRERIANLSHSFSALGASSSADGEVESRRLLLIDDVFTTGSTMCAGADALNAAGAQAVYGLTFARV